MKTVKEDEFFILLSNEGKRIKTQLSLGITGWVLVGETKKVVEVPSQATLEKFGLRA